MLYPQEKAQEDNNMRDKLLKNNRIGNFTNRNPINNARE